MPRDPKKVFIGMAIGTGNTRWETSMSLLSLLASRMPDYEFTIYPGGGCDVCHARNLMFHYWRTRTECGLCLFIDSDVKFEPHHVVKLVQQFLDNPDILMCGGLYPLKGTELRWSYGGWSVVSEKHPGLWEVFELCGGFTGLRYELLEELIAAHPDMAYRIEDYAFRGETGYEICAMGPVTREWEIAGDPYSRRVSEDFYLSMRVRDLGHPIYVDHTIQLGHIGNINLLDLHRDKIHVVAQGHA